MGFTTMFLLYFSVLVAALVFIFARYRTLRSLPLPPGPPAHPIFGNARDVPASHQWEAFSRLSQIYGPIMHMRVLTQHIIVLSSLDDILELFERRGNIYSDRPEFTMMGDLMGWGYIGSLVPYGEWWRAHRRVYHHYFHEGATKTYLEVQAKSNIEFLRALLRSPHRFMEHIQHLTTSSIMSLTYGIDVVAENDPWAKLAHDAMDNMTAAGLPGSYAVEWIPALKLIPAWFPGASWKRFAQTSKKLADRFRFAPLEWTRGQIRSGDIRPSIAASLIQDGLEGRPLSETLLADVLATLYVGGADTTVSLIAAFFMCMVMNPDKQTTAQEELDRVVGHGRLPENNDRDSLPYVTAVLLEVIRLYPVLPLGVPHRVMDEDEYKGMRIPRGSTIFPNVWSILRDETVYAEPDKFLPERYVKNGALDLNSIPDPRILLFGFGRRICPGRHFADAAAWMAVSTVLYCFRISPEKDENGWDIPPNGELRAGVVTSPKPFPCEIVQRSADTEKLLLTISEHTL